MEEKYGWRMGPGSVKRLNELLYEPPTEEVLLRGVRLFTVEGGMLQGYTRVVWQTAEMKAACLRGSVKVPAAIHLRRGECSCGIYLVKDQFPWDYHNTREVTVIAQAHMWGYVLELEHGYRAENVRLEAMWLIPPRGGVPVGGLAHDLSVKYGVPVEVIKDKSLLNVNNGLVSVKPSLKFEGQRWT